MVERQTSVPASSLVIAVAPGTELGDEAAFLAYLSHKLTNKLAPVFKDRNYTICYETNKIRFHVVGGEHCTSLAMRRNTLTGYCVDRHTRLQLLPHRRSKVTRVFETVSVASTIL